MSFHIDLSYPHRVAAANSHTYVTPTEALYIDRTLIYHDFIYMIEGEWLFSETIDGQEVNYLLKPNDILILPAGNHHYTRLPCKAGTRTLCVHISSEANDMQNIPGCITLPSHLNCRANRRIFSLFKEIVELFWSDDPHKQHRLSAVFTLLICELAGMQQVESPREDVARVIQLIHEQPHRAFSAEELAELLGTSSRKLAQSFRDATGETLRAYQSNRKLEMVALQLEIEPDIRLKELACTFGFYDEFYLSKLFKKKYGLSPLEYKRKLGIKNED